ncbi:hypothetical protein D3C73_1010490 [compost metagenome]
MDAAAKNKMPLEYPRRSPRTVNILAMYLSLAKFTANSGNAEYPVFAAKTRIIAVIPWIT